MTDLVPFADDTASRGVAGLTVENGRDRVTLYGTADLTRDRAGLAKARELRGLLDAVVRALESADLPAETIAAKPAKTVRNPFG